MIICRHSIFKTKVLNELAYHKRLDTKQLRFQLFHFDNNNHHHRHYNRQLARLTHNSPKRLQILSHKRVLRQRRFTHTRTHARTHAHACTHARTHTHRGAHVYTSKADGSEERIFERSGFQRGSMMDRNRELQVTGSWGLVRERALAAGRCAERRYSEYSVTIQKSGAAVKRYGEGLKGGWECDERWS